MHRGYFHFQWSESRGRRINQFFLLYMDLDGDDDDDPMRLLWWWYQRFQGFTRLKGSIVVLFVTVCVPLNVDEFAIIESFKLLLK